MEFLATYLNISKGTFDAFFTESQYEFQARGQWVAVHAS